MGVEHQHSADQAAATPSRDNSVKRGRALPAVGIYRPPAARRSEQISPAPRCSSLTEIKPEQRRPARQRRPDIQVYVPRAKRLLNGVQDSDATSTACMSFCQHSSSANFQTQGSLHSGTCTLPLQKSNSHLPSKECKSKSAAFQCHDVSAAVSSSHDWSNAMSFRPDSDEIGVEVSNCTKSGGQRAESNCHLHDFNSEMNDELSDMGTVMTQQISTENVKPIYSKQDGKDIREMENSQVVIEDVDVEREIIHGDSKSSSTRQVSYNTPAFLDTEMQIWDCYSNTKNGERFSKTALLHCGNTMYSSAHSDNKCQECNSNSHNKKQECDTTQLAVCDDSRSIEPADHSLHEVGVEQGFSRRGSRSSSSGSTTGHSNENSLSSTDNGTQEWDYYSELKNAANNSENKVFSHEMDIQSPSDCNNITQDSGFVSKHSDVSIHPEESDSSMKCCDDSDLFLDCSDTVSENKLPNCDDREVSNCHGDTNSSSPVGSEKLVDVSEDRMCSRSILVSDECHKKDENDDCRVQEEQNRKNRRIIRGNFMSDVLIISDPDPVTDTATPSTQIDSSSENTLVPNNHNKKKKVHHKEENVITETLVPPVKVQSDDKQKSSPASSPLSVSLNPDECTWDMMFDDNGECLHPKLMEELTNAVGSVTIEKPQSDYHAYQSRIELMMSGAANDEFSHVLEIYNFPAEFKTHDLYAVFSPYMKGGFEIKWVDDTHALGVFSSSLVAAEVLASDHPFVKTRPLHEATLESRMKARRSAEFLQPYRARPETCAALARRLVTGALGVRLNTTREEREAERKLLNEAREKKRLAARQRDEAWEGTLGEK